MGRTPPLSRFPTYGRFCCWGLIRRLRLQLLRISTYIMRRRGRGQPLLAAPPRAAHGRRSSHPSPQTLASPPPHNTPAAHRRSPPGVLHHHRHHAVVLPGFRGGSATSAARWNGEKDVFINTERVTEYGGAARLWHHQDLLRAFSSGK